MSGQCGQAMDPQNCACCTSAYQHMIELLDQPCSEQRQNELRNLIAECPGCFEKLGIEEDLRALVKKCCCEPAPEQVHTRIRASLAQLRITFQN